MKTRIPARCGTLGLLAGLCLAWGLPGAAGGSPLRWVGRLREARRRIAAEETVPERYGAAFNAERRGRGVPELPEGWKAVVGSSPVVFAGETGEWGRARHLRKTVWTGRDGKISREVDVYGPGLSFWRSDTEADGDTLEPQELSVTYDWTTGERWAEAHLECGEGEGKMSAEQAEALLVAWGVDRKGEEAPQAVNARAVPESLPPLAGWTGRDRAEGNAERCARGVPELPEEWNLYVYLAGAEWGRAPSDGAGERDRTDRAWHLRRAWHFMKTTETGKDVAGRAGIRAETDYFYGGENYEMPGTGLVVPLRLVLRHEWDAPEGEEWRAVADLGPGRTLVRLSLEEADALLEEWGLSRETHAEARNHE